ncbi:hypothetical protein BGZ46_006509 [Entomortierella lignicola]|nr:hypothetical protein BGZ46_006509 [Entomortierella lignicola]
MDSSIEPSVIEVFTLPEILSGIAIYLDAVDVYSCSRVSRSFYTSFSPFVWQDLHFGDFDDSNILARYISLRRVTAKSPDGSKQAEIDNLALQLVNFLKSKSHLVKSISIHSQDSIIPLQLGRECTQLNSIMVEGLSADETSTHQPEYWAYCKEMLRRNQSQLRSLSLRNWEWVLTKEIYPGQPTWHPLLTCSQAWNLKSLSLDRCSIHNQYLPTFWSICARLETLRMYQVYFNSSLPHHVGYDNKDAGNHDTVVHSTNLVRFPRLKEFYLGDIYIQDPLRSLICHCPVLQTLNWSIWRSHSNYATMVSDFKDLFLASTWPDLRSVTMPNVNVSVTDEEFRRLLQTSHQSIRLLEFGRNLFSAFRYETIKAPVTTYSSTLQTINFSTFPRHTSVRVIDTLTICSGLQKLFANTVSATDLIESKPWVCHSLQELGVFIDMGFPNRAPFRRFTEEELNICRSVFQRLAFLKNLRVLDLLNSYRRSDNSSGLISPIHHLDEIAPLPMRLKAGLQLLAELRKLENVSFWGGRNKVHMQELSWMADNWKELKNVAGKWWIITGTQDDVRDDYLWKGKLRDFLKSRGVSTIGSWYLMKDGDTWVGADYEDCCGDE